MRPIAEELADTYGGILTYVWSFGGFVLTGMSEESARALSEDQRVEYVQEGARLATDTLPTPVVER